MTPDPADPADPADPPRSSQILPDPGMSSKSSKNNSNYKVWSDVGPPRNRQFWFSRPDLPKSWKRCFYKFIDLWFSRPNLPTSWNACFRISSSDFGTPPRSPQVPPRSPKATLGTPKGSQRALKSSPRPQGTNPIYPNSRSTAQRTLLVKLNQHESKPS